MKCQTVKPRLRYMYALGLGIWNLSLFVYPHFQEGYSSVRFWPAVVERMVSNSGGGEWEVEFVEDEVSRPTRPLKPAMV